MKLGQREEMEKRMQPIIGEHMKLYRLEQKLSQEAMAKQLGISCRTYIDLENQHSLPSGTTLAVFLTMISEDQLTDILKDIQTKFEE